MKCPCCKYEYIPAQFDFIVKDRMIRSGKNKGKVISEKVYAEVAEKIGDEEFKTLIVIIDARFSSWSNSLEIDTTEEYLNICPKCGVTFKEIE